MTVKTMQDLFVNELRDLYHAEKQLLKALPKMRKAANNVELKQCIDEHLDETQGSTGSSRCSRCSTSASAPSAARRWRG